MTADRKLKVCEHVTLEHDFTGRQATLTYPTVKEVGHTFIVMVCILPIFNSLWHNFGIVIFDA